jgi:acetamidase/formamidase
MTIAADRPLESAVKLALRDMVLWLEEEYGYTKSDAYMLLSLLGSARPCQNCGWSTYPFTASVRFPKTYLEV